MVITSAICKITGEFINFYVLDIKILILSYYTLIFGNNIAGKEGNFYDKS